MRFLTALLCPLTLIACAQEPAPELAPVDADSSKEDILANYTVIPVTERTVHLGESQDSQSVRDIASVEYSKKADGTEVATVRGTLVTFDAASAKEQITISVDEPSFTLGGARFRFFLYTRGPDDEDYQQFEFVYPGRRAIYTWFDEVHLELENDELAYDPVGDGFSIDFHNELPGASEGREYAVFVVPHFRWFRSLEGEHDYELSVKCDGGSCY